MTNISSIRSPDTDPADPENQLKVGGIHRTDTAWDKKGPTGR